MIIPYDIPHTYVARNDRALTTVSKPVTINVLENDTDYSVPDLDDRSNLHVFSAAGSRRGSVEIVENGTAIRYTPNQDFQGTDHVTYLVKHRDARRGENIVSARVDIEVGQ